VSSPRPSSAAPRPAGWRLPLYRTFAWVTGVGLVLLVFYAMPMKYFFDTPGPVAIIGMLHGFLYMAYIVATLVLAERVRFTPGFALLVLLAGTIPIASFVAERKVTRLVQEKERAAAV
jgi:integral membrane protein